MPEALHNIVLGIIRRDDDVLLIERQNKERGKNNESLNWAFPGGKIEPGETPFAAVEREVSEETGHYVEAIETIDERRHPSFPAHIHYIACKLSDRNPEQINDSGVLQAKWIPIAKLGIYITSSLNESVQAYLNS